MNKLRGKPLSERYILFSGEDHDKVQLDVTIPQLEKFILLWNEGFSINTIYRRNNIHKVTAALLAMDLEMSDRIKPRENGLIGWRLDDEYSEWWEAYKNGSLS